jgi:carbonic anhydrase
VSDFDDIVAANQRYAETFHLGGLAAPAALGLGVLTCIDSRIEPLTMLGLRAGDAKIMRNAGARLTQDAVRSLVLATHVLNVSRILIVTHTDCAMGCTTDDQVKARVREASGVDLGDLELYTTIDPRDTLRADVARLRSSELLAPGVVVAGFEYDVHTGLLSPVTT